MIWALLAAALLAATAAWMIYVVEDHHRHRPTVHVARWAVVPVGMIASAGLAVHALTSLTNGLPI